MKKLNHNYKCQVCGKPAKYNIQETYITYKITDNGDFKEIEQNCNGDNDFFCEEHLIN